MYEQPCQSIISALGRSLTWGWSISSDTGTPGGKLSTIHPTLGQWLSPYVVTRNNWPKVDMMEEVEGFVVGGGLNQDCLSS